jgi:cytochrome c oxidase subunit II
MKLDKIEKRIIIATMALMGLFVFSLLYAKDKYDTDVPECLPYDNAYSQPKVNKLDSLTYEVYYVASMWQFQPAEVFIPVGSEVDMYLTSKDVVHGFNISNKNVNMMATYGALNKVRVKFDKPGIYDIVCHEYCGVGHQNMRGQVIVNYPK